MITAVEDGWREGVVQAQRYSLAITTLNLPIKVKIL